MQFVEHCVPVRRDYKLNHHEVFLMRSFSIVQRLLIAQSAISTINQHYQSGLIFNYWGWVKYQYISS